MKRTVFGVIRDKKISQELFIDILDKEYDIKLTRPTLRRYNDSIDMAPFRFVLAVADFAKADVTDFIEE